jgi:beta-galactosidase/beta-glucuronidase
VPSGAADWSGVATWHPDRPMLYDLRLELADVDGHLVDAVETYFGMRKVEARHGCIYLNNQPFYSRLVLDQGYFPGGLLTAPTDEDLRRDIELAKELGFNGARKHQKVEDPRWLYWADTLGFVVWGEMANCYRYSSQAVRRLTMEWATAIERDYNHPCILAWVPMNESWGVPALMSDPRQRDHLKQMYHLTHSLDATRLVVSNDGWEHATTDLCTIHDYRDAGAVKRTYTDALTAVAAEPAGRPIYTTDHGYQGEPILLTEFGGIAVEGEAGTWGYRTVRDGAALLDRYRELITAVVASGVLQGFCYTQLTDVEQEANGLLTYDRQPKAPLVEFRKATQQRT